MLSNMKYEQHDLEKEFTVFDNSDGLSSGRYFHSEDSILPLIVILV